MTDDRAALLAMQLSLAHRRVRELEVGDEQKALATRRLLAISDASKRDVDRAAKRLHDFLQDLDDGVVSAKDRRGNG